MRFSIVAIVAFVASSTALDFDGPVWNAVNFATDQQFGFSYALSFSPWTICKHERLLVKKQVLIEYLLHRTVNTDPARFYLYLKNPDSSICREVGENNAVDTSQPGSHTHTIVRNTVQGGHIAAGNTDGPFHLYSENFQLVFSPNTISNGGGCSQPGSTPNHTPNYYSDPFSIVDYQ
ncbi:uncharacterized protein DSM5745_05830 [Aspergillus mulundensis]|uniref:Uncharacterized protein n=1 Tax=Aspergillus mulundensis TaxID=1810919 RepID=A0A3D8RY90_9EURO|nr:hypothetical protein DSM5745_05830 [Aspergillus mulundensis]RDW78978.1 hypothetical protein DSM5745_05830 [Aspergillus mulundensis]